MNFFLSAKLVINIAHPILFLQDICAGAQNFAVFNTYLQVYASS
jgi:hypothetical protein